MSTVREFISEIRQNLQRAGTDNWLPGRYIHAKGIGVAALILKREADDKRLYRYTDLWAVIDGLEMEERDLVECCGMTIPGCKKVMVSKNKLPELFTSRSGYLVQVTSVDYDRDYTLITPKAYKHTRMREFQDRRKRYAWIENDRLVIPDSTVRAVRVNGMFMNKAAALALGCSGSSDGPCASFLDQEFVAPPHLLDAIKDKVTKDLLGRPMADEYTNLNAAETIKRS